MEQVATLVQKFFGTSGEELLVGGCKVGKLASTYDTPLFAHDAGIAERKLSLLREALPAGFAVSYSVKANPNPAFLNLFLSHGCGLEVASAGELYQALNAGCPAGRILFAGPGKKEAELEFALSKS